MGRAYAIVRVDYSGTDSSSHVTQLERLAAERGHELVGGGVLLARSDSTFCVLLATLDLGGVCAILVPSIVHVAGWLEVMRRDVEVWTVLPPGRWPRRPAPHMTVEIASSRA